MPTLAHPASVMELGPGLGTVAFGTRAAGTRCQQFLELTPGSKGNSFPASMETL